MESTKKSIGWRELERTSEDIKKKEHFGVALSRIRIRPGFNRRDLSKPATQQKIANLKAAYMAGNYVPPIVVSLVGGEIEIVDGECRYTAACQADAALKEQGKLGIKEIIVLKFEGNDAEKYALMIDSSNGERLLPIEVCDIVKQLIRQGWSSADIEARFDYSRQWVAQLLDMANMPERIKALVRLDKVSVEVALAIVAKHAGNEEAAIERIEAMIAAKDGKVTGKDLPKKLSPAKAAYKHVKTLMPFIPLPDMATAEIEDDREYALKLNGKAFKALLELRQFSADK
jgi:ParB family transcriptional regulator, chromosome partitioning protein